METEKGEAGKDPPHTNSRVLREIVDSSGNLENTLGPK